MISIICEWIPLSKGNPDYGYVIACQDGDVDAGSSPYWYGLDGKFHPSPFSPIEITGLTHYMRMPEIPSECEKRKSEIRRVMNALANGELIKNKNNRAK